MAEDTPIIFSGPMVRAIIEGRKTQTRRALYVPVKSRDRAQRLDGHPPPARLPAAGKTWSLSGWQNAKPGDRLWVRENVRLRSTGPGNGEVSVIYRADEACGGNGDVRTHFLREQDKNPLSGARWTPSIHMPRWANRLTLVVRAVRIEPLHRISRLDALAEGVDPAAIDKYREWFHPGDGPGLAFKEIWDAVNGSGAFDQNPEVVVLTFEHARENIDDFLRARAA